MAHDEAGKSAAKATKAASSSAKKSEKASEAASVAVAEKVQHAAATTPGHHAGHEHKPNRREYAVIFVVLFVLTVLEVAVAQLPGISHTLMGIALVGLALTKAACVGLFYMHLKHETKVLRAYVALPFAAPAVYALVLIAEAAWRLTR